MKHHPSCRHNDIELMRVCHQCGNREPASEEEAVIEAAKGLRDHGADIKNGTHANILWTALDRLKALQEK